MASAAPVSSRSGTTRSRLPWYVGQKPRRFASQYLEVECRVVRRCECRWCRAAEGRLGRGFRPASLRRLYRLRVVRPPIQGAAANAPNASGVFLGRCEQDPDCGGQPDARTEEISGCEKLRPNGYRRVTDSTADARQQRGRSQPSTPRGFGRDGGG